MTAASRPFVASAVTFALVYAAYAVAYLNKRNLRYNVLLENNVASAQEIGLFGSAFETAQGPAKILSGVVVDAFSPTWILVAATAGAGVVNLAFTRTPGLTAKLLLWGTNGALQAFSWPALSTVFMNYFKDSPRRGTLYAILSTSQNCGAALTPAFVTLCVSYWGWEASFWVPGSIALACAVAIALFVRDKPSRRGGEADAASRKRTDAEAMRAASSVRQPIAPSSSSSSLWEIVGPVVTSPAMWALGASYAFNSLVRSAVIDWAPVALEASLPSVATPALVVACVTAYEIGGAAGGFLSGVASDVLFAGRRGPVMVTSSAALAGLLVALAAALTPDGLFSSALRSHAALLLPCAYAAVGFLAFAPHVLNGLMTRELAPVGAGATAAGFSKSVGQVGAACAGYPIGVAAYRLGWPAVVLGLAAAALLSSLSVSHLWGVAAADAVPVGRPRSSAGSSHQAAAASDAVVTPGVVPKRARGASTGTKRRRSSAGGSAVGSAVKSAQQ